MRLPLRGRKAVMIAGVAGVAASLAFAGTATASTQGPANSLIVGSGSATTYQVMTQLDDLFNGLPGCNLIAEATTPTQPLNFSCTPGATALGPGNYENPNNDVAAREPAIGSSLGIEQLELQGSVTPPSNYTEPAPISYAASSRLDKPTDLKGLNFVAYAKDGVDWFHWTKVVGKASPSAGCTDLSQSTIADIWAGTITNWDKVENFDSTKPCGTNATIDVYTAQAGSGTESTWNSFLACGSTTTPCDEVGILKRGSAYADSHIIFENEDKSIVANKDESTAIFFFSYGKYEVSCKTVCGGTAVPGTTSKLPSTAVLGEINGVAPTPATILGVAWPVPRYLYNVYADGDNSANIPTATQATLNFVSEDGFLCKPNTVSGRAILDPNTGVSVRTEIEQTIVANGFLPLDELTWVKSAPGTGKDFPEGDVTTPAVINTAPYDNVWGDPALPNSHEYTGYCLVYSTDTTGPAT